MKILIIMNGNPYDGTDVAWNALRLAEKLIDKGIELKVFLMNDSVDLAREGVQPPEGYSNLTQILMKLIGKEVLVKVCGTCMVRCGIHKENPLIMGAMEATMPELAEWIEECDKLITF